MGWCRFTMDSPRIVDDLWDSAHCGDSADRGTAQMHHGMVQIHCGTLVDALWEPHLWMHCGNCTSGCTVG